MSLSEAVQGDLRTSLEALRDHLAKELEEGVCCKACGGVISSPTAPLAKQLRDTLTQLAGLSAPKESKTDDLKAKRDARRRRPGLAGGAAVSEQRGG